ncbi:hypothetical protein AB0F73_04385 [Micromonospora purpureochromogenes]|uniref:hypothetical protein n=1 Tax=Micromonospora purpureochromogenes TaxID=47872 RepID=UPI0033FF6BA8
MVSLVVAALALLGGMTWLAMNQPVAGNPVLNRRLIATGLLFCVITAGVHAHRGGRDLAVTR